MVFKWKVAQLGHIFFSSSLEFKICLWLYADEEGRIGDSHDQHVTGGRRGKNRWDAGDSRSWDYSEDQGADDWGDQSQEEWHEEDDHRGHWDPHMHHGRGPPPRMWDPRYPPPPPDWGRRDYPPWDDHRGGPWDSRHPNWSDDCEGPWDPHGPSPPGVPPWDEQGPGGRAWDEHGPPPPGPPPPGHGRSFWDRPPMPPPGPPWDGPLGPDGFPPPPMGGFPPRGPDGRPPGPAPPPVMMPSIPYYDLPAGIMVSVVRVSKYFVWRHFGVSLVCQLQILFNLLNGLSCM